MESVSFRKGRKQLPQILQDPFIKSVMKILGVSTGINIILNLIVIPRFSFIGAAAATVADRKSVV
jgi:hypothetical protein